MDQHNEPDQVPAEACSWPAAPSRLEPGPREAGAKIEGWIESEGVGRVMQGQRKRERGDLRPFSSS